MLSCCTSSQRRITAIQLPLKAAVLLVARSGLRHFQAEFTAAPEGSSTLYVLQIFTEDSVSYTRFCKSECRRRLVGRVIRDSWEGVVFRRRARFKVAERRSLAQVMSSWIPLVTWFTVNR